LLGCTAEDDQELVAIIVNLLTIAVVADNHAILFYTIKLTAIYV